MIMLNKKFSLSFIVINIANMWKDHYSSLLNSSSNITDKDDVCTSFKNMCFNHGMHVSVSEVLDLLRGQSNDKATGMDGLSGESLKFADPILVVLLSICFTCMFNTVIFQVVCSTQL